MILALIFAAIVLVLGLVITQSVVDTQDGKVTLTVINETLTAWAAADTNQTLAKNTTGCGFTSIDVDNVLVYNVTDSVAITSGNYTAYANGNIINISDEQSIWAWQITYPYSSGGEACIAGNTTIVGLATFADFWEIIVLAVVITIVIGLLLVVFGREGRR